MTAVAMRAHDGALHADGVAVGSPRAGEVRVTVAASGVCGADIGTVAGALEGTTPVTPGHEVAGTVAELGTGVTGWRVGDRVAVGWFGGSCGHCDSCRHGDPVHCPERRVPGLSYPGGWSETITVPADALARVPDELDLVDAAPMGCAGVTTFNAVRRGRVRPGGRVAVVGLGGLGHLAVQFAAAMGYHVTAIARGRDRAELARGLGADRYLDGRDSPGSVLHDLGGVDAIVHTVPASEPVPDLVRGLRPRGHLVLVGIGPGEVSLPMGRLVSDALTVTGHLTGSPADTEEAMRFAVLNGIRPLIEHVPLEQAPDALDRLRAGAVRCRVVLDARTGRDGRSPA